LITPDIRRKLYRCIEGEARDKGCAVLALNGTDEHVHLVVSLPTTVTVAELVQQVKGVSSHMVNAGMAHRAQFKWQGYYGAFTVSRWDVEPIVRYVQRQQEHHACGQVRPEWEESLVELER
jgi:REP element-mobilizing transposase RayT